MQMFSLDGKLHIATHLNALMAGIGLFNERNTLFDFLVNIIVHYKRHILMAW